MSWGSSTEETHFQNSWGSTGSSSWGCSGWRSSDYGSNVREIEYLAWGSSEWGTSVAGPRTWGTSGFGSSRADATDWGSSGLGPSKKSTGIVKHRFWCTEGIRIWGGSNYRYGDSCPGCRHDRAIGRANTNKGSAVVPLVSMFVGSKPKLAKKSLWND